MPAPRKPRAPDDSSDRKELDDLLRTAAKFFQVNSPEVKPQFASKQSSSPAYATVER